MHNYTQLRAELMGKGFTKNEAFKAVRMIELEDIITEILHAEECRSLARVEAANKKFWAMHARLMEKHRLDWVDAMYGMTEPMLVERVQRKLLSDKGSREKSVLLAVVLKYFCIFDDWQVAAITGVIGLPSVPQVDEKLDGLGLNVD